MIKTFFQGFNLARALILIFIVGSAYGGVRAWDNHERIAALKENLGVDRQGQVTAGPPSRVEQLVRQIQENSVKFTEFTRQLEGEGLTGQDSPQSYIRSIAIDDKVRLGRLNFTASDAGVKPGYTDKKWRVKPLDPNEEYGLDQISNFLVQLEAKSKRVRVTSLSVKVPGRADPQEIPSNRWNFDCEVTVREKNDSR